VLAIVLFLASTAFVELFARLAVLEYGASSATAVDACKWDCGWYSTILVEGYHLEPTMHPEPDTANWAFFPAFPIVAKLLSVGTGAAAALSLVLTSKFFLLLGLFAFVTAAGEEIGPDARLLAGIFVAFNPYVIYAHAGYTESLYFLMTTVAFLALRRTNWIWAGIAAGMLSGTRLVGILFCVSYLAVVRQFAGAAKRDSWPRYVLGLLLSGLGLALYMVYLYFHVGDALAFTHIQVAWGRSIQNPMAVLSGGLQAGGWERYFALVALASVLMSLWFGFRGRYHYAIFLAGATLLPLATGLGSIPRYVFWQMPFLIGLVDLFSERRLAGAIYLAFSIAMSGFVILSWFSGKAFVT
jgi:hypothetical protein